MRWQLEVDETVKRRMRYIVDARSSAEAMMKAAHGTTEQEAHLVYSYEVLSRYPDGKTLRQIDDDAS